MIHPLRSVHRLIFATWILVLPAVFIGGLLSRHHWPAAASTPPKKLSQGELLISEKSETAGDLRYEARLLTVPSLPNARAVEIVSKASALSPDVLVYWSASRPGSNLPASAQLLGPYLPQQQTRLPSEANGTGFVILYSLAQQRIVSSFPLGNRQ
jgi:hypothetical protein